MSTTTASNRAEVVQRLNAVIEKMLGVPAADVKPASTFAGDLGADSLDAVEMLMEVEDEFGIEIDDDTAEITNTVGKMHDLICSKLNITV